MSGTATPTNLENAQQDGSNASCTGEEPCPLNKVKPHIEPEYKVVLLDRKLADHQESSETPIRPDPTYVYLWVTQTNKGAHPWKKNGKLTVTPANVEVFRDQKCTKKAPEDLTAGELTGGAKLKLWLRGVTAGKFTVKLELEDPEDEDIVREENPAEQEMSVVEVVLEVHHHDPTEVAKKQVDPDVHPVATYHTNLKNEALDQDKLSDEDKVKKGRLLHEQSGAHFGRAKLIVKKLEADQWPDGTDSHVLVLDEKNESGGLKIFDAEFDGAEQAFPVKLKVSDLKSAEKTLWVEGRKRTKAWRHGRLDLGMDRPVGGVPKKPKSGGDWGRFTVVKIHEVALEYKPVTGKPVAWQKKKKRFFINLKDDPDGRKVKIVAKVAPKLEGIVVHFMLAPDKDNLKNLNGGTAEPTTWKWKDVPKELKRTDKNDRKDLLHLSEKTDADGKVEKELILSRCGGHKFTPSCYIEQDPHLAKYVHGHTDLGKRVPVQASHAIEVWRRYDYQISVAKADASKLPSRDPHTEAWEAVHVFSKEALVKKYEKATVPGVIGHPAWQYTSDGSGDDKEVIAIGSHNIDTFKGPSLFTPAGADDPPKAHVIACMEQYDGKELTKILTWSFKDPAKRTISAKHKSTDVSDRKLSLFDPSLSGDALVKSAKWKWSKGGTDHGADLGADAVKIKKGRSSRRTFTITIPAKCGGAACKCGGPEVDLTPSVADPVKATVQLRCASGPWAGWAPEKPHTVAVIDQDDPKEMPDTMAHEVGHLFDQVRTDTDWNGIADHGHQFEDRGGSGSHCAYNAKLSTTDKDDNGDWVYERKSGKDQCIMYHSGGGGSMRFDPDCSLDLRIRDLRKFV